MIHFGISIKIDGEIRWTGIISIIRAKKTLTGIKVARSLKLSPTQIKIETNLPFLTIEFVRRLVTYHFSRRWYHCVNAWQLSACISFIKKWFFFSCSFWVHFSLCRSKLKWLHNVFAFCWNAYCLFGDYSVYGDCRTPWNDRMTTAMFINISTVHSTRYTVHVTILIAVGKMHIHARCMWFVFAWLPEQSPIKTTIPIQLLPVHTANSLKKNPVENKKKYTFHKSEHKMQALHTEQKVSPCTMYAHCIYRNLKPTKS